MKLDILIKWRNKDGATHLRNQNLLNIIIDIVLFNVLVKIFQNMSYHPEPCMFSELNAVFLTRCPPYYLLTTVISVLEMCNASLRKFQTFWRSKLENILEYSGINFTRGSRSMRHDFKNTWSSIIILSSQGIISLHKKYGSNLDSTRWMTMSTITYTESYGMESGEGVTIYMPLVCTVPYWK